MTFCLGIKVEQGLVGIADTRITTGPQRITARKVSIHEYGEYPIFVMTSGLRSVRVKLAGSFVSPTPPTDAQNSFTITCYRLFRLFGCVAFFGTGCGVHRCGGGGHADPVDTGAIGRGPRFFRI